MDVQQGFRPTFTGSRQEHWVIDALVGFYEDKWLTDVLYRVKSGKDATVFCCEGHPSTNLELIAAKIYRPKAFRTMRNDAMYRAGGTMLDTEGKTVRDRRSRLAIRKKTRFGRHLETASWIQNEYQAMIRLHDAGADMPKPLAQAGTTILMEYVGDASRPAPTLHEVRLEPEQAGRMFDRLMRNVELFLACDRVHGDLSAYNILCWDGDCQIIDLPQSVDPNTKPSAFFLLSRDVERLCQYFAKYGVESDPEALVEDLWWRFLHAQLTPVPVRGDSPP